LQLLMYLSHIQSEGVLGRGLRPLRGFAYIQTTQTQNIHRYSFKLDKNP
jgi:hypothetical protein